MSFLREIISNKPLIISAVSWLVAGVLKMFINLIIHKSFSLLRILGSGGMPSSHTSTVVALAISTAFIDGVYSTTFAIAVILMIIVVHDARGVRLETGKQAEVLNKMMFESEAFKNLDFEKKLKEYVGHTPLQVLVGAIVGVIVALFMIFVIYR